MYANVIKSSKYASQRADEPFQVRLIETSDPYCWAGNDNKYRTGDLEFFVKTEEGFAMHGLLRSEVAVREVERTIAWADKMVKSGRIDDLDAVYREGQSDYFQAFKRLETLIPTSPPICDACNREYRYCQCV